MAAPGGKRQHVGGAGAVGKQCRAGKMQTSGGQEAAEPQKLADGRHPHLPEKYPSPHAASRTPVPGSHGRPGGAVGRGVSGGTGVQGRRPPTPEELGAGAHSW